MGKELLHKNLKIANPTPIGLSGYNYLKNYEKYNNKIMKIYCKYNLF